MIIELKSHAATAKIDSKGAQLLSFKPNSERELMWQRNPDFWAKTSPTLFPVVGNLQNGKAIIDGKPCELPKHGFAGASEFEVIFKDDAKASFNLSSSDATLAGYPYKFSLTLTYTLTDSALTVDYTVENADDRAIYYCLGAHPAFNIPNGENFSDYSLRFEKSENAPIPYDLDSLEFNPNASADVMSSPDEIKLQYKLFDNDAFVFEKINSESVRLQNRKSGHGVQVDFHGFSSVAFWTPTKKSAPFICVEPWNGMAARTGESDVYEEKYGAVKLEKGEHKACRLVIKPM